ncbi:MAG: DNA repair exonuclease, partial [Planctomycetaceae bacterium]
MFKFLHAADLHLDSPLRGLDRYEGAPVDAIRQATRRAVENLVELAIAERVAFVVIAGDVYDGDWPDYNTGLFFARQMAKLGEAGIAVYLISGNHDAESVITRSLMLPENVAMLRTDRPESRRHQATNCVLHGQGFATRAVTADLSANYPAAERGSFNIGILHTSAGGSSEHETYAPCTIEGLRRLEYDYWALGHIHLQQKLCDNGSLIAFSGNTQGRHIRETGPKGCLLVTVDGGVPSAEFRPLDVFRWERCATSATGCDEPEDVLDLVRDD